MLVYIGFPSVVIITVHGGFLSSAKRYDFSRIAGTYLLYFFYIDDFSISRRARRDVYIFHRRNFIDFPSNRRISKIASSLGVVGRTTKVEDKEVRLARARRLTVTRVRGISVVIAESETTVKPPFTIGPSLTFHWPPTGSLEYTPDRPESTYSNPTTVGATQPTSTKEKAEWPNDTPISTSLFALLPFAP